MINKMMNEVAVYRRYHATFDALTVLSDRQLHDIGLERAEISIYAWNAARAMQAAKAGQTTAWEGVHAPALVTQ